MKEIEEILTELYNNSTDGKAWDKAKIELESLLQQREEAERGKERTLEDEALEFIESDVENYRLLASALGTAKVMAKFAEQLLKKEKPTRPFYNEGDGGLP